MKDYKKFNGRIKMIPSNIAQMNIFEWMYYRRSVLIDILSQLKEGLELTICGIINLLLFILYPIIGIFAIRKAKKEVKRCNK